MPKMKHVVLLIASLVSTTLSTPGIVQAAGFNQFVVFGDSTLDTGYFRYNKSGNSILDQIIVNAIANGDTGGWAGNGVMNTTILAGKFGLSAAPVGDGGTNYANGGATTVTNNAPVIPTNVTTIQQIENYLSSVNGVANPNALYLIKTGDNDATYVTNQGAAWIAANPNYLSNGAIVLATEVASLQAAGARIIVVRNSYDSALFAGYGGDISNSNAAAYARTVALGTDEWSSLTAAGVHFIPDDNDSLFRYVVKNPALFGFTATSVLAANAPALNNPYPYNSALTGTITPIQQQTFLFIDDKHLTTAGQTIEADYTYSLLTAPSQISLLAESAVQTCLAQTATIQRQVEISGLQRGSSGINVWAAAGAGSLDTQNAFGFPSDSGTPFKGAVGVDYKIASDLIVGGALSAGRQSQSFSTGGQFDQDDEAVSLYAAYSAGPVWGNAVATYGSLQNSIMRSVNLGIFTDQNKSDPSGQSLLLAIRGGFDFQIGQFTTGPVLGIVVQEVQLNGFTETGTSGITALSFNSQTRDSEVTQLGWRGSMAMGNWRPFAETVWNHDWCDKNREVTALLTTVSAPSFSLSAAPVATDWGTISLGTSYRITPKTILWADLSEVFASSETNNYGVELGLTVSF